MGLDVAVVMAWREFFAEATRKIGTVREKRN
jgi:hypothetical protein